MIPRQQLMEEHGLTSLTENTPRQGGISLPEFISRNRLRAGQMTTGIGWSNQVVMKYLFKEEQCAEKLISSTCYYA